MAKMSSGKKQSHYLSLIGIAQYHVRNPLLFQGDVKLPLQAAVKLIIVTDTLFSFSDLLVIDLLAAMRLSHEQIYLLAPSRLAMIPPSISAAIWLIDHKNSHVLDGYNVPTLITPSLDVLRQSPKLKKQLWSSLCHYAYYFSASS